jgi:uncharacterized protein with HEPN domain
LSRQDRQRLIDIASALDAIRSHLRRGGFDDGLVFEAVRVRLIEIGEATKSLPSELLESEPSLP